MTQKLRIWRVVPTSITGVQAPTFFVETTENGREDLESRVRFPVGLLEQVQMYLDKESLKDLDIWIFLRILK